MMGEDTGRTKVFFATWFQVRGSKDVHWGGEMVVVERRELSGKLTVAL